MQRNPGKVVQLNHGVGEPSPANETDSEQMRAPDFWKSHYVPSTDRAEIDLALRHACLKTGGESLELIYFHNALDAPQGSGGHGYAFAELAYRVHRGASTCSSCPSMAAGQ